MTNLITPEQFFKLTPNAERRYCTTLIPSLNKWLGIYQIDRRYRLCAFLAQAAHETGGFRRFIENLNYSWGGLRSTFPKYYPSDEAARRHHRLPETIANHVYGGRMGNTAPGDGYRYRGRGIFQLTGKNNYQRYSELLQLPLVENPDMAAEPDNAARIACAFWIENGCNPIADEGERRFAAVTRKINGGLNGQADREALYKAALKIWV